MNITDELLMAYADGELDAATRAELEAVIARDPAVAARVQEHQELRQQLKRAFDPILDEEIPQPLRDAVSSAVEAKPSVVDLAHVREQKQRPAAVRQWSWVQWGAVAASLVLGLFIGRGALQADDEVIMRNGQLFAASGLEQAMNHSLSAERTGEHQVGFSYRSVDGQYCRTFVSTGPQAIAGVACRESGDWRIKALTETEQSSAQYRTAASAVPAAVRAVVEASMTGEPLSVEEEKAAIAGEWK